MGERRGATYKGMVTKYKIILFFLFFFYRPVRQVPDTTSGIREISIITTNKSDVSGQKRLKHVSCKFNN